MTSSMDDVFKALADPSRRQLLDSLNVENGQTLRDLCAGLDMARQSVSKHLAILEAADLVVTVRQGREKLHYLNAGPINDISDRWITRYDRARTDALSDLKRALEATPMTKPAFVYRTYIDTTPEQLWRALTEREFTERYWGMTPITTWEIGAPMTWDHHGVTITDPEQVVREYDPYRRLSYTWHAFTPELGAAFGFDDDLVAKLAAERRSTVSFELEPVDSMVKLKIVHEGFDDDSTMADMIVEGWPRVVSDLKTLLETGHILPRAPQDA